MLRPVIAHKFCHTIVKLCCRWRNLSSITGQRIKNWRQFVNSLNANGSYSWTFCLRTTMKHLDMRRSISPACMYSNYLASFIDWQNILTGVKVLFIGLTAFNVWPGKYFAISSLACILTACELVFFTFYSCHSIWLLRLIFLAKTRHCFCTFVYSFLTANVVWKPDWKGKSRAHFQPIEFVNSVLSRPCKTQPYI